ncbi:MAG: adenylate/guanylate cyclase domain-containing protein [Alphaproteobacteria bacterium]|nr:adenylate/guanylate cyclase domain-containing protein [Alphaproteobacteria bacterium]
MLDGTVRRGQVEAIRAAVRVSDMRGFTALSDRLSTDAVIELPDSYFEAVARPIEERGGEILKFIGALARLDFTVVGRAVNEASRVEALCRVLARPLLATAPFAQALGGRGLVSLGFHALRGVREPQEIFGVEGLL